MIILSSLMMFSACKSPTFTYVKEVDHNLPLYEFKIDSTFQLYTRTICKDKRNFPIDCVADTVQPVEVGYIILSDTLKKVLVINNVPNRNQKFFDKGIVYDRAVADDTVFINAFFFKQFRFGVIDEEGIIRARMKFTTAEKHPRIFHWNYDVTNNDLLISSVENVVPAGIDRRYTEDALYLVPRFRESRYFKLVFQLPANMTNLPKRNKSEVRIFIHQKSRKNYVTYIEFATPVHKDFRAIKFAANRMYAFSK